jgi:hypothetical protein
MLATPKMSVLAHMLKKDGLGRYVVLVANRWVVSVGPNNVINNRRCKKLRRHLDSKNLLRHESSTFILKSPTIMLIRLFEFMQRLF